MADVTINRSKILNTLTDPTMPNELKFDQQFYFNERYDNMIWVLLKHNGFL